ncbi:MAG: tRNA lysidine(34) synthetase TilS [Bacteroidaceae bacterium]|nr:tRNA lysidine(34) synthetase TilS [Bacteroidaceae bacterium]
MNLLSSIQSMLPSSLASGSHLLVALSGGADSVCLLLALQELGYRVEALHVNFELRGAESDGDEAFCRRLCRSHDIPLSVRHFRTRSYAQRHAISLEMAARQLRYDWFREQMKERGAVAICVAHHRDDNIETLLLNLVRGTGLRGLAGMKSESLREGMRLLRPLLRLSRKDIEEWLKERGQTWVTDSTNLQADVAQRNFVRLRLLPLLEELNPRVREVLDEDIRHFEEAEKIYDGAVNRALAEIHADKGSVDVASLKKEVAPRTLLHEWLHPLGFNSAQIQEVAEGLDGASGSIWESPTHRLLRDRGRLLLQPSEGAAAKENMDTKEGTGLPLRSTPVTAEEVVLPLDGLFVASDEVRLLVRRQAVQTGDFTVPRDKRSACFDLEKLQLPLTIRRVRQGDRMQPFGMEGTRLISDLLTDAKLSLFERERQLVVLSADRIVWLVGLRAAAGGEIDESTRHAMTITML